jgi:hypothetical protein
MKLLKQHFYRRVREVTELVEVICATPEEGRLIVEHGGGDILEELETNTLEVEERE